MLKMLKLAPFGTVPLSKPVVPPQQDQNVPTSDDSSDPVISQPEPPAELPMTVDDVKPQPLDIPTASIPSVNPSPVPPRFSIGKNLEQNGSI